MTRSSVVLPEPEGPAARRARRRYVEGDVAQRRIGAEILLDALDANAEAVRAISGGGRRDP